MHIFRARVWTCKLIPQMFSWTLNCCIFHWSLFPILDFQKLNCGSSGPMWCGPFIACVTCVQNSRMFHVLQVQVPRSLPVEPCSKVLRTFLHCVDETHRFLHTFAIGFIMCYIMFDRSYKDGDLLVYVLAKMMKNRGLFGTLQSALLFATWSKSRVTVPDMQTLDDFSLCIITINFLVRNTPISNAEGIRKEWFTCPNLQMISVNLQL